MAEIHTLAGLEVVLLAGDDESGPIDFKVRWILSAGARSHIYAVMIDLSRMLFRFSVSLRP